MNDYRTVYTSGVKVHYGDYNNREKLEIAVANYEDRIRAIILIGHILQQRMLVVLTEASYEQLSVEGSVERIHWLKDGYAKLPPQPRLEVRYGITDGGRFVRDVKHVSNRNKSHGDLRYMTFEKITAQKLLDENMLYEHIWKNLHYVSHIAVTITQDTFLESYGLRPFRKWKESVKNGVVSVNAVRRSSLRLFVKELFV